MLFNSWEFLLVFLPITFIVYFTLTHHRFDFESKAWLFFASLVFYGWWNPGYLFIILSSITVNFVTAHFMRRHQGSRRKSIFITGIVFNIGLLGYYKYADFFIQNFNHLVADDFNLLNIILPLGISFFTFQQIAFLFDTYYDKLKQIDFISYGTFVTFFPQLIAGPITHHRDIMPQFNDPSRRMINPDNIARGLLIFNIGLAKKIIIADTFGKIVSNGYGNFQVLSLEQSWITAFAYTIQLYFDFSGYSDMAIGLGLFFNIDIPINFNSPHRANSIQDFYRRWHITLSSFMRDYIYIPLGGNKVKEWRIRLNLFLTFLIGGFWHGANWTFVVWGALNGFALIVHRMFKKAGFSMNQYLAVVVTFVFVMLVRVFFRATDVSMANTVLLTMFGIRDSAGTATLITSFYDAPLWIAGVALLFFPNTNEIGRRFSTTPRFAMMITSLFILNFLFLNSAAKNDFLYFDF